MMMRGRLLETVGGVPVYAKAPAGELELLPGRRGRFEPGGQVYEVSRVSPAAAYVFKVYEKPIEREVGDTEARDRAVMDLGLALANPETTEQQVYAAAYRAAHAARAVRRILVSRGPVEPGISRGARFVERVYPS